MTTTDTRIRPTVADNVAAEISRRGLQKTALLPVLPLSRNTLYSRLSGKTAFDTDELEKVAAFLGIPVTTFWGTE